MKYLKTYEEINFKKTLAGVALGSALLGGCGDYNPSNPTNIKKYHADSYYFGEYIGKTINNIRYGDAEGFAGDYLIIGFTDTTNMKIYAYKYDMEILDGSDYKEAPTYNFSKYKGKTIKEIKYGRYEGHGGDLLKIYFDDGTKLVIYAYKYTMEIHK